MDTATLVQEVKSRKPSLNKDKHTDYLTAVAPDHLEYAKGHTNNSFMVDGVETIPREVISFVADACELGLNDAGIESERRGEVSYKYALDYPPTMMRKLRRYKRVSFS